MTFSPFSPAEAREHILTPHPGPLPVEGRGRNSRGWETCHALSLCGPSKRGSKRIKVIRMMFPVPLLKGEGQGEGSGRLDAGGTHAR